MKRQYMQPLTQVMLIATEPLMALSQQGTAVTFEDYDIEEDASQAAARTYNVWDDDEDSERDDDEV